MGFRPRTPAGILAAGVVLAALAGCVPSVPETGTSSEAIGPQPPGTAQITLTSLAATVQDADRPATALFSPGDSTSTAGDDLASETEYWQSVGGEPDVCAGVVSSAYLVSAADVGARADDPTALLGSFTEVDEDRFGLIQVYGRLFDDAAGATGFLDEFSQAVAGCPGYRFVDAEGAVSWSVTALELEAATGLPAGVQGLRYRETLSDTDATDVTTTVLVHDNAAIAVYAELYPSSTLTSADADAIARAVADRLGVL